MMANATGVGRPLKGDQTNVRYTVEERPTLKLSD